MQLETITRNYEPTRKVSDTIEERADKFTRFVPDHLDVKFTLAGERHEFTCDIHIHLKGKDIHTAGSADDMLVAIDRASSSMDEQLRRHKARRTDHRVRVSKPGTTSAAALEATFDQPAESDEEEI